MTKSLFTTLAAVAVLMLFALGAAAQEHQTGDAAHQPASQGDAEKAHPTQGGDAHATGGAAHSSAGPSHDGGGHDEGPVPPADKSPVWAGVVLILILAMFVMAAVIGPVARAHAPPAEMPPTHSHDEPPGASHHHGASGTINPEPGHGHH